MAFEVFLSEEAERDIEDLYRFIAQHDSIEHADKLLLSLEDLCRGLEEFPERGNVPKELAPLGMAEFREVHFKPYRVIYRLTGSRVIVYCVVDGRRDMRSFLQRRILR